MPDGPRRASVNRSDTGSAVGRAMNRDGKEKRRMNRRRQLAAALIEADNEVIQHRLLFLSRHGAPPADVQAYLSRVRSASESAIFTDASTSDNMRPVYTYPLPTIQETSRTFLNMSARWEDDTAPEHNVGEEIDNQHAFGNAARLDFKHNSFGSPMLHVLGEADLIRESYGQTFAPASVATPNSDSERPGLKSSVSMPQLSHLNADTRSSFLWQRIQQSNEQNESTPELDSSMSSHADSSTAHNEDWEQGDGAYTDPLGIKLGTDTGELASFRQRVLKHKDVSRRSSGRRHSLSSGWPSEMHAVADEAGLVYDHSLEKPISREEEIMQLYARDDDVQPKHDSSRSWAQRLNPFKKRTKDAMKKSNQPPPLAGLSPVVDAETAVSPHQMGPQFTDEDMMGISLQSPMPNPFDNLAFQKRSTSAPASATPLSPSGDPAAFYATDADVSMRKQTAVPSYICIPMPLRALLIDRWALCDFFVPHGAFVVDNGVILPSVKNEIDTFAPVQVPLNLGRRALYPSTALFRNALVTRDEEREGWGWECYTNAARYFADLGADDDDSDDELPLMDVRIHTRGEYIAHKRQHRERVRRIRQAREWRRLRELAQSKGEPPSKYGVPDVFDEEEESDLTDGADISDDSDPELPWVDDRRPVGRLYDNNLINIAARQKEQQLQTAKYYGHQTLVSQSDPSFTNDTRERMHRLFGDMTMWADEKRRYSPENMERASSLETVLEPNVASAIVYPTSEEVRKIKDAHEEAEYDHVADEWRDGSDDEEETQTKRDSWVSTHRYSRFMPSCPPWMERDDDVPLLALQNEPSTSMSDDDEIPLGTRHPQAELFAEKEAKIRRLQEENAQMRAMLMRSSMPPLPYMPWVMPCMPTSVSESHGLFPDGDAGDDVPAAYMYDPSIHTTTPVPEPWTVDDVRASTWRPTQDTPLVDVQAHASRA